MHKNYKTISKKPNIKWTNRYINSNLGVPYDVIIGEISLVFDEMGSFILIEKLTVINCVNWTTINIIQQ